MLNFLAPIANLANTFVEGRVEKTKAVAKAKVARAEAEAEVMKVAATHEAGWEKIMAEASRDSWKDEAWTILFIAIIAASFIPWCRPYIARFSGIGDSAGLVHLRYVCVNSSIFWHTWY